MDVTVRHPEPGDSDTLHRVFSGPKAAEGTLQLPLPSEGMRRKRPSGMSEGLYALAACVDGEEVVGDLTLETRPTLCPADGTQATIGRGRASGRRRCGPRWIRRTTGSTRRGWGSTYAPIRRPGSRSTESSGSKSRAPTGASPSAKAGTPTRTRWRACETGFPERRSRPPDSSGRRLRSRRASRGARPPSSSTLPRAPRDTRHGRLP